MPEIVKTASVKTLTLMIARNTMNLMQLMQQDGQALHIAEGHVIVFLVMDVSYAQILVFLDQLELFHKETLPQCMRLAI
jgi:uncharacterized membrane protein